MIKKAVGVAPLLSHHEKRRAQRRIANWKVNYRLDDGVIRTSNTRDVSTSGCSFVVPKALANKEKVFLRLHAVIKGYQFNIDAIATSRHTSLSNNEFVCGFEFSKISDHNSNILKAYVNNAPSEKFALLEMAANSQNG